MDIQATKIELIQRLLNESSESVLLKVQALLNRDERDLQTLNEFKESYERAQKDKEEGHVTSHLEVKKKYEKWL